MTLFLVEIQSIIFGFQFVILLQNYAFFLANGLLKLFYLPLKSQFISLEILFVLLQLLLEQSGILELLCIVLIHDVLFCILIVLQRLHQLLVLHLSRLMLLIQCADLLFQLLNHLLLLYYMQISIIYSSPIALHLGQMLLILKANPKLMHSLLQRYPEQLYLCSLLFAYGCLFLHDLLQPTALFSLFNEQLIEPIFR